MQINQHQVISNEAQKGYHFEEVVGMQIVVLGGSLRKGSVNYGIVKALEQIKSKKYFENVYFHVPDLSILPLLNYDLVKEGSNLSNLLRNSKSSLRSSSHNFQVFGCSYCNS